VSLFQVVVPTCSEEDPLVFSFSSIHVCFGRQGSFVPSLFLHLDSLCIHKSDKIDIPLSRKDNVMFLKVS
jgi:hypothetical protein